MSQYLLNKVSISGSHPWLDFLGMLTQTMFFKSATTENPSNTFLIVYLLNFFKKQWVWEF